ncbi:hypothetical protein [uncultured Cardiobacterium sp.]|uniref:hypothetical protein n=1 Tax=uncultured Cardiobacterium sp. TaxID=417619 RepID=UPI002623EAEE|nr:hypothetical protein [uncultured Cardiobacterium sp.]
MQKQRITAAIATALCILPATAATTTETVTQSVQSAQVQPDDSANTAARLKAARLKSAATANDANIASTETTTAPPAAAGGTNGREAAPATTAAPKTRQYAKEYAIQYCRENEMTGEKDPVLDRVISDSWFGQERGEFHEWHKCVAAKTKDFAIRQDPAKAEYNPTDQDRAYAKKYCSQSHTNPDGTRWYGRGAEAEQPIRHLSNNNLYLSEQSCLDAKTAESYYGATKMDEAPFAAITNEQRARNYCTLVEFDSNDSRGHYRYYGAGIDNYATEQECIDARIKKYDKEDAEAAKIRVMQPWDGRGDAASPVNSRQNPQQKNGKRNLFGNNANVSDDCAIWLCLPAGFPDGCEGAKKAFKKRMRRGRAPMPPFEQCAVGDDGQPMQNNDKFTYKLQSWVKISLKGSTTYEPGTSCRTQHGDFRWGCSRVLKVIVYQNGKETGSYFSE